MILMCIFFVIYNNKFVGERKKLRKHIEECFDIPNVLFVKISVGVRKVYTNTHNNVTLMTMLQWGHLLLIPL